MKKDKKRGATSSKHTRVDDRSHELPFVNKIRGEHKRDVIRLRMLAEDKRAFRRMLTSVDQKTEIFFRPKKKNSEISVQKSEIFFLDEKKNLGFSVQKSEIFFFGRKKKKLGFSVQKSEIFFLDEKKETRIFSAKIRNFF